MLLEERAEAAAPPARKPVPWRHGLAVGALVLVVLVLWLASGDDEPEAEQVVNLDLPQRPAQTVDPDQNLEPETAEDGHDYGLVSNPERTRNALAEFHDNAADFEQAETRRPDDATGEDVAAGEDDGSGDPAPAPPTEPEADAGQPAPRPQPATTPDADNGTTATNGTTTTADKAGDSDNADDGADAPSGERTVSASEPELSGLDARLGYRQEDWLATRDDGEWFLQLVATGREDGARGCLTASTARVPTIGRKEAKTRSIWCWPAPTPAAKRPWRPARRCPKRSVVAGPSLGRWGQFVTNCADLQRNRRFLAPPSLVAPSSYLSPMGSPCRMPIPFCRRHLFDASTAFCKSLNFKRIGFDAAEFQAGAGAL